MRLRTGVLLTVAASLSIASTGEEANAQIDNSGVSQTDQSGNSSVYTLVDQFGGPSSVGGQLAEDAVVAPQYRCQECQDLMAPWFEHKSQIAEDYGLQFGLDETILYQGVDTTPGINDSASGIFRVFGQIELIGRGTADTGSLVFKAEDRHRIAAGVTPFALGLQAGSAVLTGTTFSDFHLSVTQLFWKQYFCEKRIALAAGRMDVSDFVDVYAMMNPQTHFLNLAFSTNPTIAVPNQGMGVVAAGMITDHLYVQGGFSDANGVSTQAGFDTFLDDSEYFSYAEVGLTTSQDRIYLDNVHATFWHTDARATAGAPRGQGFTLSAQKFVDDKWLPFARYGYADGEAALMQNTFSAGIGLQCKNRDVFGTGISWGKPANSNMSDQFTSEIFYRLQLTEFLAVTPDVQFIVDPANNPNVNELAFFGIRLRAAF
jgi:porin